jgi:hypothetical protein
MLCDQRSTALVTFVLLACGLFSGCSGPSDAEYREKMIGTWRWPLKSGEVWEIAYLPDGTQNLRCIPNKGGFTDLLASSGLMDFSGTWTVNDGHLTIHTQGMADPTLHLAASIVAASEGDSMEKASWTLRIPIKEIEGGVFRSTAEEVIGPMTKIR